MKKYILIIVFVIFIFGSALLRKLWEAGVFDDKKSENKASVEVAK